MKKAEPVDPATRHSSCTQELVAGYWLIQVKSKEEAIEWAKRAPFAVDLKPGAEAEIEMRPLFDEPPSPARGERCFGMLVDRFAIPWMINCEQAA